jgi:transposase
MQETHVNEASKARETTEGNVLTPFQRRLLLKKLQADLPVEYRQRIQIMLLTDEGQSQAQISQALKCSRETVRHWALVAKVGKAHEWQDTPLGRPKTVNEEYLNRLRELVMQSPRQHGYSFHHWTAYWLSQQLEKELNIKVSDRHINRLLKTMGLSLRQQKADLTQQAPQSKIAIQDLSAHLHLTNDNFFSSMH